MTPPSLDAPQNAPGLLENCLATNHRMSTNTVPTWGPAVCTTRCANESSLSCCALQLSAPRLRHFRASKQLASTSAPKFAYPNLWAMEHSSSSPNPRTAAATTTTSPQIPLYTRRPLCIGHAHPSTAHPTFRSQQIHHQHLRKSGRGRQE